MRCALYARYSSELQDGANSIARQRAACARWAREHGAEIVAEYLDEGISGATIRARPGLQRLLADLRLKRWDAVLVDDASRLDRAGALAQLAATFGARGVALITVDSGRDLTSEDETLLLHVQSGLSAHYLAELGRRTRAGMAQRAARGLWTGGTVFGYRLVREDGGTRIEVDDAQAGAVRQMFAWSAGGLGTKAIAQRLTEAGIRSPRGGLWAASAVRAILLNPRYVGEWRWQTSRWRRRPETGIDGEAQRGRKRLARPAADHVALARPELAIVDRGTWAVVQEAFSSRRGRAYRTPQTGPLAGLIVCAECGHAITRAGGRGDARYLACGTRRSRGPAACGNLLVQRESVVLEAVVDEIADWLSPENVRSLVAEVRRDDAERARAARRPTARNDVRRLEAEVQRLTDAIARGEALEPLLAALRMRQAALAEARERADVPTRRSVLAPAGVLAHAAEELARLRRGEHEVLREMGVRVTAQPYAGDWSRGWTLEIEARAPSLEPAHPNRGSGGGIFRVGCRDLPRAG